MQQVSTSPPYHPRLAFLIYFSQWNPHFPTSSYLKPPIPSPTVWFATAFFLLNPSLHVARATILLDALINSNQIASSCLQSRFKTRLHSTNKLISLIHFSCAPSFLKRFQFSSVQWYQKRTSEPGIHSPHNLTHRFLWLSSGYSSPWTPPFLLVNISLPVYPVLFTNPCMYCILPLCSCAICLNLENLAPPTASKIHYDCPKNIHLVFKYPGALTCSVCSPAVCTIW